MAITTSNIYTGLWTNWAKGSIVGATITVPSSFGTLLTAFLAIFVQLAGGHIWHLMAYILHRSGNTDKECHPIIRQQQAILKNTSSPIVTAIKISTLGWAWRARRPFSDWLGGTLLIVLLSTLCAATGILAGLFSSLVISTSDIDVLLRSPNCGFWDTQNIFEEGLADANVGSSVVFAEEGVIAGQAYARQCYNASSLKDCNTFSAPTINWKTDFLAPCPFASEMCIGAAMEMDTGPINTNAILGLNFGPKSQLTFRKVTTCAPITQDGFVTRYQNGSQDFALYEYGPTVGVQQQPYTWPVNLNAVNLTKTYTMASMAFWADASYENDFDPITELNRTDGDGTLFFLSSNDLPFAQPCDDPWFAAHIPDPSLGFSNETFYVSDHAAGVLGCLEQYQVCNPGAPGSPCTTLTGIFGSTDQAASNLNIDAVQNVTIEALFEIIAFWDATMTINAASTPPNLLAQSRTTTGSQFPLASNQWQIEMQNWFAAVMSTIQERLTMRVIGPSDRSAQQFVMLSADDAERSVCDAQRVRVGQDFNNVSLLGLLVVLVGGSLIILCSVFLDSIVSLVARVTRSTRLAQAQENWFLDDVLQIQRVAYKGQSFWSWSGETGGQTPIPEVDCLLGPLDEGSSMKGSREFTASVYLSQRIS